MAVVTVELPLPAAHEGSLPSPTLTNPDMILPKTLPPSPPRSDRTVRTTRNGSLVSTMTGASWDGFSENNDYSDARSFRSLRSISSKHSRANGRRCEDRAHTLRGTADVNRTLASSPTIQDSVRRAGTMPDARNGRERRLSDAASSVCSADLENFKWPGFDGATDTDGMSVMTTDDEDRGDRTPKYTGSDDDVERWREAQARGEDEDFLSRRAEMILANAKRKLNLMEGNLRGARSSLVPPADTLKSLRRPIDPSYDASTFSGRHMYPSLNIPTARNLKRRVSTMSASSSIHSRGASDASYGSSTPAYAPQDMRPLRSSSALGTFGRDSPISPFDYGRSVSVGDGLRESRSYDNIRLSRIGRWGSGTLDETPQQHYENPGRRTPQQHYETPGRRTPVPLPQRAPPPPPQYQPQFPPRDSSLRSPSLSSLGTLPENEIPASEISRPPSTTSELHEQMERLKGRISSLKERAQEDKVRRQSSLSIRTPSPFTAAETWYSGSESYKGSPLSTDAGVGWNSNSEKPTPVNGRSPVAANGCSPTSPLANGFSPTSPVANGVEKELPAEPTIEESEDESQYDDAASHHAVKSDEYEQRVDALLEQDEEGSEVSSTYEEALDEQPERHEDRADAFDYEHFFLHSAMGSYRRGSSSSEDSVETTKPARTSGTATPIAPPTPAFLSPHMRKESMQSISSTATFETATEGRDEEEDEATDDETPEKISEMPTQEPSILRGALDRNWMMRPKRSSAESDMQDSGIGMSEDGNSPRFPKSIARRESASPPRSAKQPASDSQTSLVDSEISESGSARTLTEQEKQLVNGLMTSFEQVCQKIRTMPEDDYDTRVWRRRLDLARRVLQGDTTGEAI